MQKTAQCQRIESINLENNKAQQTDLQIHNQQSIHKLHKQRLICPKTLKSLPKSVAFQQIMKIHHQLYNQAQSSLFLDLQNTLLAKIIDNFQLLDYFFLSISHISSDVFIQDLTLTILHQLVSIIEYLINSETIQSSKIEMNCIQLIRVLLEQYMEIVSSYCLIVQNSNCKQYWEIYSVILLLLNCLYNVSQINQVIRIDKKQIDKKQTDKKQIDKSQQAFKRQLYTFEESIKKLINMKPVIFKKLKLCLSQFPVFSHQKQPVLKNICKSLRNFVTDDMFIKTDNSILAIQKTNSRNNCDLLIKIVTDIFINYQHQSPISNTKIQIQFINIIIYVCEGTGIGLNQNSHQFIQFAIFMGKFLNDFVVRKQNIDNTSKQRYHLHDILECYIYQLLSIIFFKNPHSAFSYIRKQKLYQQILTNWALNFIKICSYKSCESIQINLSDEISTKRMILGFLGLLRLDSFETILEQQIKRLFPICIKSIQTINGNQVQKIQQLSQNCPQQQTQITSIECIFTKQELWDQQLEYKSENHFLQSVDQVEELKLSIKHLGERNPQLFNELMNTFSAQQIILWTLELQEKQIYQ